MENDFGATVMGDASDLNIGGLGKPAVQEMEVFRIRNFEIFFFNLENNKEYQRRCVLFEWGWGWNWWNGT